MSRKKQRKENNNHKGHEVKWYRNVSNVLSIAAVIISIFALFISILQTHLQNSQYDSQKKENQLIFQVNYHLAKLSENNDSIYDTDIMRIKNVGREVLGIYSYSCRTFVNIHVIGPHKSEHRKNKVKVHFNEQDLFIPIDGYYKTRHNNFSLVGDLLSDSIPDNYLSFCRFKQECSKNSNDSISYGCFLEKFVVIGYIDIYDEYHELYFNDGYLRGKEYYDYVMNRAGVLFKYNQFNIDTLKFEDIKKYIAIDRNNEKTHKYKKSRYNPYTY